jgi:hypothetical protein
MNKTQKTTIAALTVAISIWITGCADPAFQNYIASRQTAISTMPNGYAKYEAQQMLDLQILTEKRRQQEQLTAGVVAAAASWNAGQAYNQPDVNVYVERY